MAAVSSKSPVSPSKLSQSKSQSPSTAQGSANGASLSSSFQKAARWSSKLPMLQSFKKFGGSKKEPAPSGASAASASSHASLSAKEQVPVAKSASGSRKPSGLNQSAAGEHSVKPPTTDSSVSSSLAVPISKSGKRSFSAGRPQAASSPQSPSAAGGQAALPAQIRKWITPKAEKGAVKEGKANTGVLSGSVLHGHHHPSGASPAGAPTSIPSPAAASVSKLKSNQVGPAAAVAAQVQQASLAVSQGLSSSGTLAATQSTGSVWDEEQPDHTSTRNSSAGGDSDVEAAAAAKAKFDLKYKIMKQLGSGGHSTVRLANRVSDNHPVVLKFIRNSGVWHWAVNPVTQRRYPLEIDLMKKFALDPHPNIIRYYEHFELNGKYIIVMEYLGEDWVDLYDYIEMYGPVREDITAEIFRKVVDTILYLFKKGYHHNDIKDENILINTRTRQIKLIDFGSATSVEPGKTCELFYGTKKFAAPEAVRGEPYHPEAQEVWALGTLLFVLLFKLDPFTTDEEILTTDIGRRIARYRNVSASSSSSGVGGSSQTLSGGSGGSGGLDITEDSVKSLKMMMEKDWTKRIRLNDIRNLPIFKRFPF
ncbi:hypothetical protein HDU96_006761 [Phlyctochytrium bullatum]|nr:hypothetical protein HDU96_006761 [Phlyctochytrium bullatum]